MVLGTFEGVPATKRRVFHLPAAPDRIILYQRNIETVCCNEAEIRHEIRQTVLHELGHYFGMEEANWKMSRLMRLQDEGRKMRPVETVSVWIDKPFRLGHARHKLQLVMPCINYEGLRHWLRSSRPHFVGEWAAWMRNRHIP